MDGVKSADTPSPRSEDTAFPPPNNAGCNIDLSSIPLTGNLLEENGIQYSTLEPEDYEAAKALIFRDRILNAPTFVHLRRLDPTLTQEDLELIAEDRYVRPAFATEESRNLSVKATDIKTGELIGLRVSLVRRLGDEEKLRQEELAKFPSYHPTVRKLVDFTQNASRPDIHALYGVSEYCTYMSVTVDKRYAGHGICTRMNEISLELNRRRGLAVTFVGLSHPFAVHIFRKLGFVSLGECQLQLEGFPKHDNDPTWTWMARKDASSKRRGSIPTTVVSTTPTVPPGNGVLR